jgi:thiosulfate reductase cytochrome b subunit
VNVKDRIERVYRHPLAVRATHWLAALALIVLAMSGMQIFNAHPALYASDASNFSHPVFAIGSSDVAGGGAVGYVQFGPWRVNTTGVFGVGLDGLGGVAQRAFPSWLTIPAYQDLADGRRWHIFFAWIFVLCALVYARFGLKLWPSRADFRELPRAVREHVIPWRVAAAARLNPLQKLSYFAIVFIVAPIVILSGLALSPAIDAHVHWLTQLFGGRQFARLWHFAGMLVLAAFFAVHLVMVALTGLVNNVRSMITGWFEVKKT